jgi:hypothetical protein
MTAAMAEAIVAGAETGPGRSLTVLHDERCPLCRRLRSWLAGQETIVPIRFLAAGSDEVKARFPDLDHSRTTTVLTVVTDAGEVFEGARAWLVCGWALPAWHATAARFSGEGGRRVAAIAARLVDGYRHHLMAAESAVACQECRITPRVRA